MTHDDNSSGKPGTSSHDARLSKTQLAFKKLAMDDFGFDMQIGLTLALFHSFASPSVAGLLSHTGHVHANPDKRTVDTSLFVYELIHGGMEGERGRNVLRRLNQLHGKWVIANEDFLFVLCVFVITPVQWIDACGWRATTPEEKETTARFFRRMGRLMGIADLPHDYSGFVRFLDDYHDSHLSPSTESKELTAATLQVIAARLPRGMRPLASELLSASLRPEVSHCLGLRRISEPQRKLIRAGLRGSSLFTRPGSAAARPWFMPGGPVPGTYPDGYDLNAIGPRTPLA